MLTLSLTASTIVLMDKVRHVLEVTSPKWVRFLCTLAAQTNGSVRLDALMLDPVFYMGRKGAKSPRTVSVEIDNFRRQMNEVGLGIVKSRGPNGPTFAFDLKTLRIPDYTPFAQHLSGQPANNLASIMTAPLSAHLAWLFETMRAKVDFAQGIVTGSLAHHSAALKITNDPLLNAATYAEISRITYRADRDLANDMRDAAMEFAQHSDLQGLVAQIYIPRIKVAYAFQDCADARALQATLTDVIDGYVTTGVDIAGLARALNTRGVVTRRAQTDAAALRDFQLASVMSVTLNDPDLIQASLFNILACLELSDQVTPAFKILGSEINYWFCEHFNVGKDTAQCSLLQSQFYVEKGDLDAARMAIERAATLMSGERNMTDIAYFFYCTAHLRLAKSQAAGQSPTPDTVRPRLIRSGRIYKNVGNIIGTRKVDRLMAQLG
ncbi:MAG: hypothetical protein ACJAXK_001744 [Yoonia sp.]|jgi:hypothetical protein